MGPRFDGRKPNEIRNIETSTDFVESPEASILISFGKTRVLCNVMVSDDLPGWLKNASPEKGWLTAEYALLPGATSPRSSRETKGRRGRTHEISRLIGRSLRAAVDLEKIPGLLFTIDCDVIQADGGTRTAAITGSYIALEMAVTRMLKDGRILENPLKHQIAAVSVGIVNKQALLDLNYHEDHRAEVDLNFVMNSNGDFIEVQGTAESSPFSISDFNEMLIMASEGIERLITQQSKILSNWELKE